MLIILWDVREPMHYSKSIGWSRCCGCLSYANGGGGVGWGGAPSYRTLKSSCALSLWAAVNTAQNNVTNVWLVKIMFSVINSTRNVNSQFLLFSIMRNYVRWFFTTFICISLHHTTNKCCTNWAKNLNLRLDNVRFTNSLRMIPRS